MWGVERDVYRWFGCIIKSTLLCQPYYVVSYHNMVKRQYKYYLVLVLGRPVGSDTILNFFNKPFIPKPLSVIRGNINTCQYSPSGGAHSSTSGPFGRWNKEGAGQGFSDYIWSCVCVAKDKLTLIMCFGHYVM